MSPDVFSSGRHRRIELRRIDGNDAPESRWSDVLTAHGFGHEPRGLTLRG